MFITIHTIDYLKVAYITLRATNCLKFRILSHEVLIETTHNNTDNNPYLSCMPGYLFLLAGQVFNLCRKESRMNDLSFNIKNLYSGMYQA